MSTRLKRTLSMFVHLGETTLLNALFLILEPLSSTHVGGTRRSRRGSRALGGISRLYRIAIAATHDVGMRQLERQSRYTVAKHEDPIRNRTGHRRWRS